MGSFGGVNIDNQNFEQTVFLAQQKALDKENRLATLSQGLDDYRLKQLNATFPDGQYYVAYDFNSTLAKFAGASDSIDISAGSSSDTKLFKKGDLVTVYTTRLNRGGNNVKLILVEGIGSYYADPNFLSKKKPDEPLVTESLKETRRRNDNKTKLMIAGAFVLGLLLSKD
jgi:hypothetical protein